MIRIAFDTIRPAVALGVVLAVVISGCSDGVPFPEPGSGTAQNVIAAVDAAMGTSEPPATTATLPEGCRRERIEDEYGFVQDVVVCNDEASPEPASGVGFVDWVGSPDAVAVAALVRDAMVLSGGCADSGTVRSLEKAVATVPDEIRASLEAVAREVAKASAACGADPDVWESHFRRATASLEEFVLVADELRIASLEEVADG